MSNKIIDEYMQQNNITNEDIDELSNDYSADFHHFTDSDKFITILKNNLENDTNITIVPDYDTDGICSGIIAYLGLKLIGFDNINIYYPSTKNGYGLNTMNVHHVMSQYPNTQLIFTTDNGINTDAGVNTALSMYNVKTIVTDHHVGRHDLFPKNALVAINPNRVDKKEIYPFKNISGTAVVWNVLMLYLIEEKYNPKVIKDFMSLLYLVGISTISDVMPLINVNRNYVNNALTSLNQLSVVEYQTKDLEIKQFHERFKIFIDELKKRKLIYNNELNDTDIGFVLSPILNSSRRILDGSDLPFELFTDNNFSKDELLKGFDFLIKLNQDRKEITKEEFSRVKNIDDVSCIIYQKYSVTHGIAGLLANKIMNNYNKPVIALSYDYGGSARAPEGSSLQDALTYVDKQNSKIILSWGGHDAAAGLKVNPIFYEDFKHYLIKYFDEHPVKKQNTNNKNIQINFSEINLFDQIIKANEFFEYIKPFSTQFPQPKFEVKIDTDKCKIVPLKDTHIKIIINNKIELIYWHGLEEYQKEKDEGKSYITATCRLQLNEFRGKETAQFIVETIKYFNEKD